MSDIPEKYKRWLRPYRPRAIRLSIEAIRHRKDFEKIEVYCMFVGYPRSGHSLVGQLINSHHQAVIAHELHALHFLRIGYTRKQIFASILRRDREFAHVHDRQWEGYDYHVPGLSQGRYEEIKVIGDKKGNDSTQILANYPSIFSQLGKLSGRRGLRIIHHVRNPYDNISTISRRSEWPLDKATVEYFRTATRVRQHLKRFAKMPEVSIVETHHEDLISDPRKTLSQIVRFLGLDPCEKYLSACAGVIHESPHKSRHKVSWPSHLKKEVSQRAFSFSFLSDYEF